MDPLDSQNLADLVALLVHDLRNPTATLSANLSFLQMCEHTEDEDFRETVEDMGLAISDLTEGLEQVAWIGRWLGGRQATKPADGSVRSSCDTAVAKIVNVKARVDAPPDGDPLNAHGGATFRHLLHIFLQNARYHASNSEVVVRPRRAGAHIVVDVIDGGQAVRPELREQLFTIEGQSALKGRSDGRYSRAAGLVAARALAEAIDARVEATGEEGAAIFRTHLRAI